MIIILILTLSILLQFVAAIMAFRLIPLTGKRLAWSLISAALMFMALRRCVPLIHILTGDTTIWPDLNAELIALAISLLMVVGISKIAPIFTDRKQAAALQQSEVLLNRIIEESPNPMWISDENGTLIRINQACCKLLNITAEEVVGQYNVLNDNIVEEQGFLPLVKSVFEEGRTVQFEIIYDTPRLKHLALQREAFVILAVTIFPIRDSSGKFTNAVIQHIDITERKRAEESLRESEEKFRYVFDRSIMGKSITLPSGAMDANHAFCEMLGYSKEEFLKLTWQEISHPDDIEFSQRIVDSILSGEKDSARFTKRYVHKNGPIVWADVSTSVRRDKEGKPLYLMTTISDITERKKAEESLWQSEHRFKELFENMSSCVAVYDAVDEGEDFVFKDFNKTAEKVENIDRKDLIGKSVLQAFPAVRVFGLFDLFQRVWRTGQPEHHPTSLYKDNRIEGWRENYVYRLRTGEVVAIYNDVTESKRAEEELQANKIQLSNALEMAHLGHWEYDVSSDIFTFNDQFYKIFRTTVEQIGGYTMHSAEYAQRFVHPDDMDVVGEETRKAIETKDPQFSRQIDHRILYADGTVGYITVRFFIVKDSLGRTVKTYGVNQDITERKLAEEELLKTLKQLEEAKDMLVQSEKLAAIGRLSAGVGHEILNPLNIISMRMQFLEMTEKLPDKVKEGFAAMFRQIERIVKITKDLSQFSRISKRDMIKKDVNQLIQHIDSLVIPRLRVEQVALETELQPDLPLTLMEPDRIEQVVLNIINNAVDALEGRENKVIKIISALTRREGRDYLKLSISDNGRGIPRENIDKLFDPFFTTKEVGKGTGLGLHICYTVIQEHGGRIWAENNAEGGASFFIEIPIEERGREP
jgi:PAS domain S-box-containing protein